jgi:hypothetical protein
MLTPTHAKYEIEELSQWRSGPARPAMLPASPPVSPVLSTGQSDDSLSPCLWLIWLSRALLFDFCLMSSACSTLWDGSRGSFLGLSFKGLCVTFFWKLRLCNLFNHIHDAGAIAANLFGILG